MPRRCIVQGCGTLITTGSRCNQHRTQQRAKYQGDWAERSRLAIARHVALYGWSCPGWASWHQPHNTHDLVLDHTSGLVLCRQVNTAKRNRGDG